MATYPEAEARVRVESSEARSMTQNSTRPYSAAHFAFELGLATGPTVGLIRSVEGGGVSTEVMSYQFGGGNMWEVWRQLGKPKYEDIKLQVGLSMSEPFYDWISEFFAGKMTRRNGAIVAADFYYNERARREFKEAMISEFSFPKFDGNDKNAAFLGITLAPEKIEFKPGENHKLNVDANTDHQKVWKACNFHFTIDGFEDAMRNVTKVDGWSVKQKVTEHHVGGSRECIKVPTRLEWPSISFYVPECDAKPLLDEFKAHVQDKVSKTGGLHGVFTTHDSSKTDLLTVHINGIQFKSATADKSDAGSEEMRQIKFEIGIESMTFMYASLE
jgi:phage tail-like protein